MPGSDLERIFMALRDAEVRYLVVGGVAVVLHGHPRFTADLDLVVQLEEGNVTAAVEALETLGYRPRAPVPARAFAEADQRQAWAREKGLTVFSLWSPSMPATEVDLFVEEPFPFDEVYARALHVDVGTTSTTIPALSDLVALKRAAGRPRDEEDARALDAIAAEQRDGER